MAHPNEITLEQVLSAREERAKKHNNLVKKYQAPLISLTINMPGSVKKAVTTDRVFREGYLEITRMLTENGRKVVYQETFDLLTGPEAYIVVNEREQTLKKEIIEIEIQHPLGRLLDIDVISRDGIPVSRASLGYPKRKCFLCEAEAHACARSQRHPIPELLAGIQNMVDRYFES